MIGLIACFFGKRFYRLILGLTGFAVGYYTVAGALVEQSEAVQIIGAVVAGLIVGAALGATIADLMIRLATSFGGATQAIGGSAALAAAASIDIPLADPTHGGLEADSAAGIITIVAIVALAVAGFLYQTRNNPESL